MRKVDFVVLLIGAAACGKDGPCFPGGDPKDAGCAEVAGTYAFVLAEPLACASWEPDLGTQTTGFATVAQAGSDLTITLFTNEIQPHVLTGEQHLHGDFSVQEESNNLILGLPVGVLTGAFVVNTDGGPPFQMPATLTLEGEAQDAGAVSGALGCSGSTSLRGIEQ